MSEHIHIGHGVIHLGDVQRDEITLLKDMCQLLYPFSVMLIQRSLHVGDVVTIEMIADRLAHPRWMLDGPNVVFRHPDKKDQLVQIISLWVMCLLKFGRIHQKVTWENIFYKHPVDKFN